jgi:hypothetical protein
MEENQLTSAPQRNRERPPRVLSEEQQLILRIRSNISDIDNKHRLQDLRFLKGIRQSNRDNYDLMVTFGKMSTRYSLYTAYRIHDLLFDQGVECPSDFLDDDAIWAALAINGTPRGFSQVWDRGLSFGEDKAQLMTYVVTAGEDRDIIVRLIEDRGFSDITEIKSFLAETKMAHRSLVSGAL